MSLRGDLFVEPDQSVNGSLSDLQRGKVREKVITNKETHETQSSMALWREEEREGGRGRERERGKYTCRIFNYVCGTINLPPSQMEKADHQCEAPAPNTTTSKIRACTYKANVLP